jgi:hypothetical protein
VKQSSEVNIRLSSIGEKTITIPANELKFHLPIGSIKAIIAGRRKETRQEAGSGKQEAGSGKDELTAACPLLPASRLLFSEEETIMDWLATLGTAMGAAWLSGINLYATVVTLGVLQRFQLVKLPGGLDMLGEWWVIGLAGGLYLIEFIADKIPAVDTVWDAIHTFIRVPAGAILAASAFAEFDPAVKFVAMIVGGGVALSSHGTKAATRVAANTSPEPVSNIALSLGEDALTFGSAILMAFHPIVILVVVLVFLIIAAWVTPKIYRALKRLFARLRNVFGGDSTPATARRE